MCFFILGRLVVLGNFRVFWRVKKGRIEVGLLEDVIDDIVFIRCSNVARSGLVSYFVYLRFRRFTFIRTIRFFSFILRWREKVIVFMFFGLENCGRFEFFWDCRRLGLGV